MVKRDNELKSGRFKKQLVVISFVVTLFGLFFGVNAIKQWSDFGPYRSISKELNETLGGGYRISNSWYCGIESNNCPSVRMIKDANFKDNDEARILFEQYVRLLKDKGYTTDGISICKPWEPFKVYCSVDFKIDSLIVGINAKQDFIGIDIKP